MRYLQSLLILMVAFSPLAEAVRPAYRLVATSPAIQMITDIPLSGAGTPAAGTSKRSEVGYNNDARGSAYALDQPTFLPDPQTVTLLNVEARAVGKFTAGDRIRVNRTGEIMFVTGTGGTSVQVSRAQYDTTAQPLQSNDVLTITNRNTTFACWYFCEAPDFDGGASIWELDHRPSSQARFALTLHAAGGQWSLGATLGGAPRCTLTLPFDPRGRWLFICVTHIDGTQSAADEVFLTVLDESTGITHVNVGEISQAPTLSVAADFATIGHRFAVNADRHAAGICIPAIVQDAIVDGRVSTCGASTLDIASVGSNRGLSGHISLLRYSSCIWATNFGGDAFQSECRTGVTDRTILTFDRNLLFPSQRHQNHAVATITGNVVNVDPYLFGEGERAIPRAPFDNQIEPLALPATAGTFAELGGAHPSGQIGPSTARLVDTLLRGQPSGQVRVAIAGNSRAVYPANYQLRLSDGRFIDREVFSNFVNMGILGQAPVYDNGLIVGHFGPIPWCNWTSAPDSLDGNYGLDCSQALPRCENRTGSSPIVVPPSQAMVPMVNSTIGTRFGVFSPTPSQVPTGGYPASGNPTALENYRGNHAAVRLKPGHSARFLVRPETGLPESDPLLVTLYFINHPTSSNAIPRAIVARSQSEPDLSGVTLPPLGLGASTSATPPAPKEILSTTNPRLANQVTPLTFGRVTVNDADNGFAAIAPGDLVQLLDPSLRSDQYNEAFIVRAVTRNGDFLTIEYEWLCRQFPLPGDHITFIKGDHIFKKVEISLLPVIPSLWRGIEVEAASQGDGLLLWGIGFRNPSRPGIVTMPIGRSGCGYWYQDSRMPRIAPRGGRSLMQTIMAELDPDVVIVTTADQGTPAGYHVTEYRNMLAGLSGDIPAAELVLYGTGPEFRSIDLLDKSDATGKFSMTVAMQFAASIAGVPMTSFFFDPNRSTSAFGRIEAGDELTESPTHPSTVQDVQSLARQLDLLARDPNLIDPSSALTCPQGTVSFTIAPDPANQTQYSWYIEDPFTPLGFAPLADGDLLREGFVVARVTGSQTNTLELAQLQEWDNGNWPGGLTAQVRCTLTRPGTFLVTTPATLSVCPTDVDCSEGVDGDDVIIFFSLWDNGDPGADFNADGGVDGDDVIAFFRNFDAGC